VTFDHGLIFTVYLHVHCSLLNLRQVFMIRSVSPLPYNIGLPYLVHTIILEDTCQPDMYHLTLTSVSWSIDMLNLCQVFMITGRSVSPLPYYICLPYLVCTLIMEDTCQPDMYHPTLISFSWSIDWLNVHQVFMIRSVSPLPYNLSSPYLVYTLIMEDICQSGMCHIPWPNFHG
jgi:hypothetical protein